MNLRNRIYKNISIAAACVPAALAAPTVMAFDYPTSTRVEYVLECMASYERPRQELIYKCTCAIDAIASQLDNEGWIELQTFNNAAPIAGERGAYLRERSDIRTKITQFREVTEKARKSCFLPEPAKR